MVRATKLVTISLPPKLLKEAEQVAREEHRTKSELLREALRVYISSRHWGQIREWGAQTAKDYSIKSEADVERIIQEYRREKRAWKK
ncbi:MAG: ribbon-helix-helix domain-containing protein [Nitrospirota bacterium]